MVAQKRGPKSEKWIGDIVGSLTDPIIVNPGWPDRPPEKIQHAITMQRMIENMLAVREGRDPLGTDAEAAWYLSSESLCHPIGEMWTRIYMYCFNKLCASMNQEVPKDLQQEKLERYDMEQLHRLKRWIYETRVKYRKEKERAASKEETKSQKQETAEVQPQMFEL